MKWLLFCMIPSVLSGQVPRDLSLDEAVSIGREKNRLVQASAARADAARARADETGAALLPSIKLLAGYTRLSDVDPFAVTVPFSSTPITISPVVLNSFTTRLSLQQPLFTGGRLMNSNRAAHFFAEAADADYRNERSDVLLAIISAYWGLYQAKEMVTLAHQNSERMNAYEQDAIRLVRAGVATQNDLLKIQVQRSQVHLARIDAENEALVAAMTLNNLLGLRLEEEVRLVTSPAVEGIPGFDMDTLVTSYRQDVRAMMHRLDAAKASLSATRGAWWPQVFLFSNYYFSRPNQRYLPTKDEFKESWDVGVQLQLDLWNWGATSSQVQQAMATAQQQEYLVAHLQETARVEINRYRLQVARAGEKVAVARAGVEQADENARSTAEKFRNGLATPSELLDAEVALLQARTSLTGATVEAEIARARLRKSTGTLE